MKNIILTIIFTLTISNSFSQKYELGKVSMAELKELVNANDTTAAASILYNKARTFFTYNAIHGYSINTEFEMRVKIYKKEGLRWANHLVSYYVGYETFNDDIVEFSNTVTYNLEDDQIVKTKLKSEGVFTNKVNKYWNEKGITMPNVKVGSVIEFKYVIKSEDIVRLPRFNFQYDVPVNYSEYKTEIPGFFVYQAILGGLIKIENESKIEDGLLMFANKNDGTKTNSFNFKQVNSKFTGYSIPALKPEPFVDNLENYRSYINHELEKTQFYDQPVKDYSSTWEAVVKSIFDNKEFANEFAKQGYLLQDIKRVLNNDGNSELSQSEKMEVVFKFVQQKLKWDGRLGYYPNKGVEKAYSENTGNCAEINIVLINMLKLAGIKVNPVLLSTRSNGIAKFPNRTAFNYLIAAAEIDGKQVLLDATDEYANSNVLPIRVLNQNGRLIREDETSEEVNLSPKFSTVKNHSISVQISASGNVSGQLSLQRNYYDAYNFREKYGILNEESYVEKLENNLNNVDISNYKVENKLTDLEKPVVERFDFSTNNFCEVIGEKMYVKPMLFFAQSKNPFTQDSREMIICLDYPKQERYNINFVIPEGYQVESIPKPMIIATEGKEAIFSMNVLVQDNSIQFAIKNELNGDYFPASFYETLKDFTQKIVDKQNEKIVLRKI